MPVDLLILTSDVLARDPVLAGQLLALNNRHAVELSTLDANGLERLISQAFVAWAVPGGRALLIALDQGADYDSPNFQWFRQRFERFVYVDRVVVSSLAQGLGIARHLYEGLFQLARAAGHDRVACEVNIDPPNPASDAFHARLGFTEVGVGLIHGGAKSVRYLSRPLA